MDAFDERLLALKCKGWRTIFVCYKAKGKTAALFNETYYIRILQYDDSKEVLDEIETSAGHIRNVYEYLQRRGDYGTVSKSTF